MSKRSVPGGLVVFIGALCWSLNAPLVTLIDLDPILICWLRAVIGSVVLLPFLRPRQLRWNWWLPTYLVSDCAVCLLVISALTMTSAPIAVGMQYTAPVWLFLCGWIATKKFSLRAFAPVCVILVGIVLFMLSGTDHTSRTGNLLAFLSGPAFALMTVASRKSAGTNPLGLSGLATLFMALVIPVLFPAHLAGVAHMTGAGGRGLWALQRGRADGAAPARLHHRIVGDDPRPRVGSAVLPNLPRRAGADRLCVPAGRHFAGRQVQKRV